MFDVAVRCTAAAAVHRSGAGGANRSSRGYVHTLNCLGIVSEHSCCRPTHSHSRFAASHHWAACRSPLHQLQGHVDSTGTTPNASSAAGPDGAGGVGAGLWSLATRWRLPGEAQLHLQNKEAANASPNPAAGPAMRVACSRTPTARRRCRRGGRAFTLDRARCQPCRRTLTRRRAWPR